MTVKVHYTSTRALRVSPSILYPEFQALICKKFDCPEDSITLWCKKKCGSLKEINNEESLKVVTNSLDDGYRITLWAYDKHEVRSWLIHSGVSNKWRRRTASLERESLVNIISQ